MTIYEFIEAINEGSDVVYTIFDCNSEEVVSIVTDDGENTTEFNRDDLIFSDYADYEVGSVDMWASKGVIHIEFNIEVEEEEDDYEI